MSLWDIVDAKNTTVLFETVDGSRATAEAKRDENYPGAIVLFVECECGDEDCYDCGVQS